MTRLLEAVAQDATVAVAAAAAVQSLENLQWNIIPGNTQLNGTIILRETRFISIISASTNVKVCISAASGLLVTSE